MNQNNSPKRSKIDRDHPIYLPTTEYKLPKKDRLKVDIEKFKLYPSGTNLNQGVDSVLKGDLFKFLSPGTKLELKYFILKSYYDELLNALDMHNIMIDDSVYSKAYSKYYWKSREAETLKEYQKIVFEFVELQTRKIYQYNAYLKKSDNIVNNFFRMINLILLIVKNQSEDYIKKKIAVERIYLPNKKYTMDMYVFFYRLVLEGHKKYSAADLTFQHYYSESEIKKIRNYASKIESFIKQANKVKI